MGRIIAPVRIQNVRHPETSILMDALVDTDVTHLVLPAAWRERPGELESMDRVELELATQPTATGEVCGPVKIQIEGFRAVFGEVLFVEMHPKDGSYEPLLGYIPLEQSQAAVDVLGHRLIAARRFDLK